MAQQTRKRDPKPNDQDVLDLLVAIQASGPPSDPKVAVFFDVVRELLMLLLREIQEGARREVVLAEALEIVEPWLNAARGHRTFAEQQRALSMRRNLQAADPKLRRRDLRKERTRHGPSPIELVTEYDRVRAELKPLLRGPPEKRERGLRAKLKGIFPELRSDESALADAATSIPSDAAHRILSIRHRIGLESIRQRLKEGRREHKTLFSGLRALQEMIDK
jgi:hypothetical protein